MKLDVTIAIEDLRDVPSLAREAEALGKAVARLTAAFGPDCAVRPVLVDTYRPEARLGWERFAIERGQSPAVLVIACSDSRVDPAILTNAEPGELFVVRNVANLVPPYVADGTQRGTSAAIEFAVRDLGVKHVIVLGHSACGGIQARLAPRRMTQPK